MKGDWKKRDLTCKHKLGTYFLKTLGNYKGREINMFYCPFCHAMAVKVNDLNHKEVIKSFKKYEKTINKV